VDICDLSRFASESFDSVIAYGGPFSYVLDRRDIALCECSRVLKPGGNLLLSVMSLWGTAHRHLNGVLGLPPETNQKVTGSGDLSPGTMPDRRTAWMHMFRASELREWLASHGMGILAMSASSCLSIGWNELLQQIRQDEAKWKELLRMELEASAEEGAWNMGTHLIAVARKGNL
jgi:SAM-dependent methyltransferase